MKISVAIITFNEQDKIAQCLRSIDDIADEIIIVDSYSNDKTQEVIEQFSSPASLSFIENKFEGHIEQKNFAITHCKYDYVLSLDADEALDAQAIQEIKKIKSQESPSHAYILKRLTNYCGIWVRHCGWYPDKKLRLFHKEYATWGGVNPHDIIVMKDNATASEIKGNILHYSYDSISDHITQTNHFTTIAAREAYARGVRSSTFGPLMRAYLKFLRDYFFKRGFLDGRYGLIICYINALSAFLKYTKIKEIDLNNSKI